MSKASSPITFISSGNLVLKDCEPRDGWRPAAVDGGVIMAAKKKHNGIQFQLTATEATLKNARAMSGAWVSMSKPLGGLGWRGWGGWEGGRVRGECACVALERGRPCRSTWRESAHRPRTPPHAAPFHGCSSADPRTSCTLPGREPEEGRREERGERRERNAATAPPPARLDHSTSPLSLSPLTSLSLSLPIGDYTTGTVTYDLAGKAAAAAVLNSVKLEGGRALDVGARWAEKGNAFSLELGGKPHPAHRIFTSINPATRAAVGSWTADIAGLTLQAARNFAKGSDQLSVGRTVAGGVKAVVSYAPQDAAASLALGRAPLRAAIRAKRSPDGRFGRPTINLGIDRDFQVEALRRGRALGSAGAPAAAVTVDQGLSLSRVTDGARSWFGRSDSGPRMVRGVKVETYAVA